MSRLIPILLMVVFISSCLEKNTCKTKVDFTEGFDKFLDDVEENYNKFDEKDWELIDEEFNQYTDRCYDKFRDVLEGMELVEFWKNAIRYGYYRGQNKKEINFDYLGEKLKKDFGEISSETKKELEQYFKKEFGKDLDKAVDEIIESLNTIGEELKDWLNNQ